MRGQWIICRDNKTWCARASLTVIEDMATLLLLALLVCHRAAAVFPYDSTHRDQQASLSNLKLLVPWKGSGLGAGAGAAGNGETGGSWWPQPQYRPDGPFPDSIPVDFSRENAGFQPAGPSLRDLIFLSQYGYQLSPDTSDETSYDLTVYQPPAARDVPRRVPLEESAEVQYQYGQLPLYTWPTSHDQAPVRFYWPQEAESEERYDDRHPRGDENEEGTIEGVCEQLVQGGQGLGSVGLRLIQYLCLEHLQREADCRGGSCEAETCVHRLDEGPQWGPQRAPLQGPQPAFTWYRPTIGRRHLSVLSEEYPGQMQQFVNIVTKQHKRMGMVES